jgi:sugar (pentulose or hexulose) kinase
MPDSRIALLDIGKTNAKLVVADLSGAAEWSATRPTPHGTIPYRHIDVAALGDWLTEALSAAPNKPEIGAIVPVAHGACAALLAGDSLALPVVDYEEPATEEVAEAYAAERDPFSETFSPALPRGLNLGRQLVFQETRFPDAFARADRILPYPQYWAWWLSGFAASEVTSLGAHTDLWRPLVRTWSELAERRGWARRFPEIRAAWDMVGTIRPDLARYTGLSPDTRVLCGIHDSNASFLRHLARRGADEPFAVVSTGTWTIVFANGAPLANLNEPRDMLANVNAYGAPVPTARFMGGREYEIIAGSAAIAPSLGDLDAVLAEGAVAWPSFTSTGGPFQGRIGRIERAGRLTKGGLAALATLYLALVTDEMLGLLGARGDIAVEGPLAANPLFGPILATFWPEQRVLRSSDHAGTLGGALVLVGSESRSGSDEAAAPIGDTRLERYREHWIEILREGACAE